MISLIHGHLHLKQDASVSGLKSCFKVSWNLCWLSWGDMTKSGSHMLPFIWERVPLDMVSQRLERMISWGASCWTKTRLNSDSICYFDLFFVIVTITWMGWQKQAWVCWFSPRCFSSQKDDSYNPVCSHIAKSPVCSFFISVSLISLFLDVMRCLITATSIP